MLPFSEGVRSPEEAKGKFLTRPKGTIGPEQPLLFLPSSLPSVARRALNGVSSPGLARRGSGDLGNKILAEI